MGAKFIFCVGMKVCKNDFGMMPTLPLSDGGA